jgi:hypothetical protein
MMPSEILLILEMHQCAKYHIHGHVAIIIHTCMKLEVEELKKRQSLKGYVITCHMNQNKQYDNRIALISAITNDTPHKEYMTANE